MPPSIDLEKEASAVEYLTPNNADMIILARNSATAIAQAYLDQKRELEAARKVVEAAKELADVTHYEWCDTIKGRCRSVPRPECDCGVWTFKDALATYDEARSKT